MLGVKELHSLRRDLVLVFLILYTFTFAIYTVATGVKTEVRNAAIAIVDEDGSELSHRIRDALLPPYFKTPAVFTPGEIDAAMDAVRYTFVVDIPPNFQADVLAGRTPSLQVNVDATAMTLAGNGALYNQSIINQELANFASRSETRTSLPVSLTIRARFNPNLESSWFTAVMQIISNVTMLSLILSGASVIREREHGTIEHLLVMPLSPLKLYRDPDRLPETLPTLRYFVRPQAEIAVAANRLAEPLTAAVGTGFEVTVVECASQIGSGALPLETLPSAAVAIRPTSRKAKGAGSRLKALAAAFRSLHIPVIGRIRDGAFLLDLRCLDDKEGFFAQLKHLRIQAQSDGEACDASP